MVAKNSSNQPVIVRAPYGSGRVVLSSFSLELRGDSELDWTLWDNWAMGGVHNNSAGAWSLLGRMIGWAYNGDASAPTVNPAPNPPGAAQRFTPLLAERWETSADGLVWTFHLRPNVTFHDGEPLSAEAVKLSIEAAKDHSGASFIWAPLKTIDIVDSQTVRFNLSYAAPLDLNPEP